MRGRSDEELEEFVTARTQDLHHDAYVLTASQSDAEHLVTLTLAQLSRESVDFAQAATLARSRMAHTAARADARPSIDPSGLQSRFRQLAALTSRQRAILLLEAVDGHNLHSAGRALHLSTGDVEQAYAAIPPELTDTDPTALRSLLQDFGDLAESPDPAATLAAIRAVPPPPRRRWWTYAAAALVIALTIATVGVTQTWHKNWLRTAAGLNHTHGTHYPAYTQGYQLVGIQDVAPGPAATLMLGDNGAVMVQCAAGEQAHRAIGRMSSGVIGQYTVPCSTPGMADLTPAAGATLLAIDDFNRKKWPVATYRKLSWGEYPVATSDFTVEKDKTLSAVAAPETESGARSHPTRSGPVLTIRSTPGHRNGTFTGTLTLPPAAFNTEVGIAGLLSPTTTGRFRVTVNYSTPWTTCGSHDVVIYSRSNERWCEYYDRTIPQATFLESGPVGDNHTVPVKITVQHALGPWTLQVVAGRYPLTDSTS